MIKNILLTACCLCFLGTATAQRIELPKDMPQGHPRVLTTEKGKTEALNLIKEQPWAQKVYDGLKSRINVYTDRGSEWLTSRLQMYWKSHATEVYVKGEYYSHAGGEAAPAPTVMYTGARSHATNYARPKLDELKPYSEDSRGMELRNNILDGKPLEWTSISKTGNIIQSLNIEILSIARDAALLWWISDEPKYAELAANVFDTYMTGIYYRNVPRDLNNGHQQTLVGMTSFEVIHEDALNHLVPLYDFLYGYLKEHKQEKMGIYAAAFKKWADNIIDNGVPHNNWNLIQARFIFDIALILEDDSAYADGKGREYYMDYVLNCSSIRQWSLSDLAVYGFDSNTGIWAECPGYSSGVVGDFANFAALFDRNLNFDLVKEMPVLAKAVEAMPQYLFPNGMIVGFGDTHPGKLRTDIFKRMISNAQQHGKREQEEKFTAMLKLFEPDVVNDNNVAKHRTGVFSLFGEKPLELDASIPAGKIEDYVSPLFYAPNVSWIVQRNGMNPRHSLMISQNASEGNHMHANGISMELYGKGYPLAPDAGIGLTLYSGLDYLEYYSQFPAHNTVCVDGISSYPVMKSNHSFDVCSCYPASGVKEGIFKGVSYTHLSFREPESRADQLRTMSIITTGEQSGYYVDVFRSRKERGGDKMHDYFYHNLGQTMTITAVDETDLNFQPTEELAFAGAHLYAYSYLFDKKSTSTDKDIRATYTIDMPDGDDIYMNQWMKGEPQREVFMALSPMTEGLSRLKEMPYSIKDQPTLTFVARQKGEAWNRPFVSIFEPGTKNEPSQIASVSFFDAITQADDFAGICVTGKSGRTDYIFSMSNTAETAVYQSMTCRAVYSVISRCPGGDCSYFMGNGYLLESDGVRIVCDEAATVTLEKKEGKWFYTSTAPCRITLDGKPLKMKKVAK